ncbi:hypothetical protein [Thermococcus gammatolerans]|uniref:Uncharacterized protein n=1 Tax=Thermococcus gammatolerans (strain DSM 15229 / JCM 11827 / EJ3) TaxID=593117 RepID=C5A5I5_THEGJ|nr:hypothetical protein [Thermococcus gammatolerans]ACS33497.1 Conserved hypothetical protein [Thermococcus gammatolerans EJ3]
MGKSENNGKAEIKKLLQEAYEFGYFIGYRGHSEWISWVRDRKEELYRRAKELGVYELIKSAYNRGKVEGSNRRQEEINLGLIEKGKLTEEKVKPRVEMRRAEERTGEGKGLEVEFARFLQTTRLVLPPEFLDTLKHLEIPRMLKLGEE